jgi:hypothetical protein
MCKMVYVASGRALPLIEWQENNPGFWVRELREAEEAVRKQFTKPSVYYLGSHEGCGCGFAYGIWPIADDSPYAERRHDEERAGRESVRRLAEYLSEAVEDGEVELYACWDGDQESNPDEQATITPLDIGGPAYEFKESQFLIIQKPSLSLRT